MNHFFSIIESLKGMETKEMILYISLMLVPSLLMLGYVVAFISRILILYLFLFLEYFFTDMPKMALFLDKNKHLKKGNKARTQEGRWRIIGRSLDVSNDVLFVVVIIYFVYTFLMAKILGLY